MTESTVEVFDPNFHWERVTSKTEGDKLEIVSTLIRTSERLVLHQEDSAIEIDNARAVRVPSSGDITAYADTICIRGAIQVPGRQVSLYARHLEWSPDSKKQPPMISVDGVPGIDGPDLSTPTAAGKGKAAHGIIRCVWSGADSKPGSTGEQGNPGAKGNSGEPGKTGGSITIGSDTVLHQDGLSLSARGGNGGNGSNGQRGGPGQDGGDGDSIKVVEDCFIRAQTTGEYVTGAIAGDGGPPGKGGAGGDAGPGGSGGTITLRVAEKFDPKLFSTDVSGGQDGAPGSGAADGAPGKGGASGGFSPDPKTGLGPQGRDGKDSAVKPGRAMDGVVLDPAPKPGPKPDIVQRPYREVYPVDVHAATWFLMMVDKAEAAFLAAGDDPSSPHAETAGAILRWLFSVNTDLKEASSEALQGPDLHEAFYRGAALLAHFNLGRNVFGEAPDFVPLGSVQYWSDVVDTTASLFAACQKDYEIFYNAATQQSEKMASLKNVLATSKKRQALYRERQGQLVQSLPAIVAEIDLQETMANKQKDALVQSLLRFSEAIQGAVGLTPGDFLDALFNISFTSTENTALGAATAVSQAGDLINKGINDVIADDGSHVKKSLIVKKIMFLDRDFTDLKEGFTLRDGLIAEDDPNSVILVGQRKRMLSIIDDFASWDEAEDTRKALATYLDTVSQRNSEILSYNGVVIQLLKVDSDLVSERTTQRDAEAHLELDAHPGIFALNRAMFASFDRMRSHFVRDLYMGIRAAAYWALSKSLTLESVVSDAALSPITIQTINGWVEDLKNRMATAHEALTSAPGTFDFDIDLADFAAPDLIDSLRGGERSFTVRFEPATLETSESESPFHGMADVRIHEVFVWFYGATTKKGHLHVRIVHLGLEELIGSDNTAFYAEHKSRSAAFRYPLEQVGNRDGIEVHATFADPSGGDGYAPVGPFATWSFSIREEDNTGLDFSGLERVVMHVRGRNRGFALGVDG